LITTNDPNLARRSFLFVNKAWGYGDPAPDHYFLALNYRMTELHGAVAVAQLDKLKDCVNQRATMAHLLSGALQGVPGLATPHVAKGDIHTFWKYCLRVDASVIPGGSVKLAVALKARGIFSAPRYIQKPAFACQIFRDQRTFGNSRFPFTLARSEAVNYDRAKFAGTYAGLEQILVLPWNEKYEATHVDYISTCIRETVEQMLAAG
jgi:dTDP-4-amino-4,6-dideoxygalactose transaminase